MQTVKTAALVVLLMTVMFGVYSSLTKPIDSVPQEVADLIQIEEEFDLNSGVPELALNDIDPGGAAPGTQPLAMPTADPASAVNTFGTSFADLTPNDLTPSPAASPAAGPAAGTLTDVGADPSAGPPLGGNAITAVDQIQAPQQPSMPNKLPATAGAAPDLQAALGQDYPSTGNTIDLPNPSAVKFDPSAGKPFQSDSMTDLKALTPPEGDSQIAKSDGSAYTPPTGGVAQAAAIQPKPNLGLANAIQTADRQYEKDRLKEALATLSVFYDAPNVSPDQRQQLLSRLDPLAKTVIYSKRHLLEQPYRVGRGEKLVDIAAKYDVPWQLLANINSLKDPVTILPGTELKVVRGPFNAHVDLEKKELTLFLNDLYAGRFPIGVGSDPMPKTGTFMVQDKQNDRTYYGAGTPIPADDPNNPYGGIWIDLGDQLCIHGSPFPTRPTDKGCISLAADYADDLFGILSQGSSVSIRR